MKIGDLVKYKKGLGQLRSGCGVYDYAIVVSLNPFVLISEFGDMRWSSTVTPENFEEVGEANRKMLLNVIDRMAREYLHSK